MLRNYNIDLHKYVEHEDSQTLRISYTLTYKWTFFENQNKYGLWNWEYRTISMMLEMLVRILIYFLLVIKRRQIYTMN